GEDQATLVQLVEPGRGDTTQPARGEDPLVGGVVRVSTGAVRRGEGGPVAGGLQGFSSPVDQGVVDVDGCDQDRSQALTQQGGVVAGPGPHFQDLHAVLDPEVFEHQRHQGGFGGGAGGQSFGGELRDQRLVAVDRFPPPRAPGGVGHGALGGAHVEGRDEQVAWDVGEGLLPRGGSDTAVGGQFPGQPIGKPEPLCRGVVGGC